MRMGRPNKKLRSTSKQTTNPNPPKYSSPTLVVGQVSSNVIHSIYGPALTKLAVESVEEYADAVLRWEASLPEVLVKPSQLDDAEDIDVDADGTFEKGEEVEVDLDGSILPIHDNDDDRTSSPTMPTSNRLFTTQSSIDNLTALLTDTSQHFSTTNAWKIHANAAKFERLLDEKYGRFRPFIESHPELEVFIKKVQRKYAMGQFSPFRKGEGPMSTTSSIMLLFMMHRNGVRKELVALVALFTLVGLEPWALVGLVCVGKYSVDQRRRKRIGGMPKKVKVVESYYAHGVVGEEEEESEEVERSKKYAILEKPVGAIFNPADLSLRDEEYDVILLGCGPEVLYTASLLSRAGKKTLVLSPREDASGCLTLQNGKTNVPFDIDGSNIAHLARQQSLLAPALCTTTDTQGGIRFARIGSEVDGYAHSILSVPGLGTDSISNECIPIVLTAEGEVALAEYCSTYLGDAFPGTDLDGNDNGNSTSLSYLKACGQINAGSGDFYLAKLFPKAAESFKSSDSNVYQQASIRPASTFLNKCLPLNTHVRALMAAIGMANENLSPDKTSMAAHVTNVCAMTSTEGYAYPVGGPRALCHAFTSVIEQNGGRVVSGVLLQELLFEKLEKKEPKEETKDGESKEPKPRCKGIRLENGLELSVSDKGAVVSFMGMIPTFLQLVSPDVRTAEGVPAGLPALEERRPLMRVMISLTGNKDDLNLTGADWYRLPNATLPRDELDPMTGQVKFGTIGVDDDNTGASEELILGEATDETEATTSHTRGKRNKAAPSKAPRSKFTSGVSWMKVSFPSAKDPSWQDRHGDVSTCVVTIEADDDFVQMFDTKPKIYSVLKAGNGERERLRDRVLKDLLETFPQLQGKFFVPCFVRLAAKLEMSNFFSLLFTLVGKLETVQICGPVRSGLTHNGPRFAIKGNRPETPYPGLYIGGADLTVGDSFSGAIVGGWLAANAIMGYSFMDHMYLGKNITSDLQQFIEEPILATERNGVIVDDVAVPFKEVVVDMQKGITDADRSTAAESSKEE